MGRVEVFGRCVHALRELRGFGEGRLFRALERVVESLLHLRCDLVLLLVGHVRVLAQPASKALDRVRLGPALRSEEHTSELQSRDNLVCRLLLEKKKIRVYKLFCSNEIRT